MSAYIILNNVSYVTVVIIYCIYIRAYIYKFKYIHKEVHFQNLMGDCKLRLTKVSKTISLKGTEIDNYLVFFIMQVLLKINTGIKMTKMSRAPIGLVIKICL